VSGRFWLRCLGHRKSLAAIGLRERGMSLENAEGAAIDGCGRVRVRVSMNRDVDLPGASDLQVPARCWQRQTPWLPRLPTALASSLMGPISASLRVPSGCVFEPASRIRAPATLAMGPNSASLRVPSLVPLRPASRIGAPASSLTGPISASLRVPSVVLEPASRFEHLPSLHVVFSLKRNGLIYRGVKSLHVLVD
jgi:hypothetical protein